VAGDEEPDSTVPRLTAAHGFEPLAGRRRIEAAFERLPHAPFFQLVDDPTMEYGSWVGEPTVRNLRSTYWRKKTDPTGFGPYDPHRHRCGVIWLHPALPFVRRTRRKGGQAHGVDDRNELRDGENY
jgi:hypothetical protein